DHHRDGVSVARHGPVVHPGGAVRGHPRDGGVPLPDRADLRADQSVGGLAVFCRRPAPAYRARGRCPLMSTVLAPAEAPSLWARLADSDLWYSFRHSPTAIVAALIALLCVVCAMFAHWLAPHNPFDLATLDLLDARLPPAWLEGGSSK